MKKTKSKPVLSKVRVVSDGTIVGTKILMPDGSQIPGVQRCTIRMDAEKGITCALEMLAEFDIMADMTWCRNKDERSVTGKEAAFYFYSDPVAFEEIREVVRRARVRYRESSEAIKPTEG